VILGLLEAGELNLTAVRLLGPHLTAENHREVLESARCKNKLQVEEIAARLWPRPDVASSVRKLPVRTSSPDAAPTPAPGAPGVAAADTSTSRTEPYVPARPFPALTTQVSALSPDRYRVQVTIGGDTLEKLRLAKDLLRHAVPSGDEAAILDRALSALLAELARRRFAATDSPRPPRDTGSGSRHIPAEVKRAVWLRDLGRCAFVGTDGRRCGERAFVEFHHVQPYAAGGEATVGNIQLRCRRHNDYERRTYFGGGNGHGEIVREPASRYGHLAKAGGALVPERVRENSLDAGALGRSRLPP
jgi:hypothetical protein